MIFGIGTDLCAADRMAAKLQKPAFVQRVFSPAEQALLNERGGTHRAETAAANFAAKEAFLKAAGTGLGGFALTDLTVLRKESGAPYFALTGSAAEWKMLEEQSVVLTTRNPITSKSTGKKF